MPRANTWDADQAIASCPWQYRWHGVGWRFHKRRYHPVDPGGSQLRSGRYHRAHDRFPSDQTWPALYLALSPATSIGEVQRHLTPALLPQLNDFRLTELRLELVGPVALCDEPTRLDLDLEDLCHDTIWDIPQRLAAAALRQGVEAMVVPSATRLGSNLVLFPTQRRAGSVIVATGYVDPRLYVGGPST